MKFTKFEISPAARQLRYYVENGLAESADPQTFEYTLASWKIEDKWETNRRPFYRVYPGYIEAVSKIDFSKFDWEMKLPIDPVAIELPETVDYCTGNVSRCGTEIFHVKGALLTADADSISAIIYGATDSGRISNSILADICTSDDGKHLSFLGAIAIGLQLVQDEPELFKPILLKRDAGKEPRPELIERAKRNGVYGFAVGEALPTHEEVEEMRRNKTLNPGEKSPHLRSMYFGLRWTGKNRAVPKMVKVKECLVGWSKIKKIPTGYYSNETEDK